MNALFLGVLAGLHSPAGSGIQAVLEEFFATFGKVESVTVKDMSVGSSSKGTLQVSTAPPAPIVHMLPCEVAASLPGIHCSTFQLPTWSSPAPKPSKQY